MIHQSSIWKYSIKIYCQSELTMADYKLFSKRLFSSTYRNSECGQIYLMVSPSKTVIHNYHFDY